jgi:universal stress protein A
MLVAGTQTILVPTDFTDASEQALDAALELAQLWRASIELLHVNVDPTFLDMAPGGIIPIPVDLTEFNERKKELLEEAASRVRRAGLTCTTATTTGKAHTEIVEYATKVGAGLVVMGNHEHTGIGGAILGHIAEKVVRHAPCPVLVIPWLAGREPQRVASPLVATPGTTV